MIQYVNKKPMKKVFKFQYRCSGKTGHLYQFDLCLGKEENSEENLEESLIIALTECL